MAIQWKNPEMKDRLLAAVIASSANLNMNQVAKIFGHGATYDAVEGQLRGPKKLARELKEEAASRDDPAATPSRAKKTMNLDDGAIKTPVKGARVTKTKKNDSSKIKPELLAKKTKLFYIAVSATGSDQEEDEV